MTLMTHGTSDEQPAQVEEGAPAARFATPVGGGSPSRPDGHRATRMSTGTFTTATTSAPAAVNGDASSAGQHSSASLRLRTKLEPLMDEVSACSALIAEHSDVRRVYRDLLRMLHSETRTSVPLLQTALHAAERLALDDPVAAGIVDWLADHCVEEMHHDEWLLEDYRAIGSDPDELVTAAGSPTIAAMVGSVYYWTLHAHPVAVVGWCAVIEGNPPTAAFIDTLQARTGYPSAAFNTLRHHSTLDLDHRAELFALIDALPLTSRHEAILGMTALQTADLLLDAADEILG